MDINPQYAIAIELAGWLLSAHPIHVPPELAKMDFFNLQTYSNEYKEYSLRSHLIQTKQALERNKQPMMAAKTLFPWP
ncbi:QWRF motif-containing protein 8 [Gossypium australe]|uniref:QWRF motif-containing protein 8 n=1 Tax=Gossypium australe TaxID=47621 RepID=A0A5B6VH57_9ROSI|nr:QWRF motif-containing protein 8 [Gossypium australe]